MLSILLLSLLQVTISYPLCGTKSRSLLHNSKCKTKCWQSPPDVKCSGQFKYFIGEQPCTSTKFKGTGTRYFCSKSKSDIPIKVKSSKVKSTKIKPKKKTITVPLCTKATATDKACRIPCPKSIPHEIKHPMKTCSDYTGFAIDTKQRCKSSSFYEHLCFRERPPVITKIKPEFVDEFGLEDFVDEKTGVVDYNNNQHLHPDTKRLSLDDIMAAYVRFDALPAPGACSTDQAEWTEPQRAERIREATPEDFKDASKTFEKSLFKNTIYIFMVMQNDLRKMRLCATATDVTLLSSGIVTEGKLLYDGEYPVGHTTLLTNDEYMAYREGVKTVHYAGNILTAETDDGITKIITWNILSGHFFPKEENAEVFAGVWGWTEIEYKGAEEFEYIPPPPKEEFFCPPGWNEELAEVPRIMLGGSRSTGSKRSYGSGLSSGSSGSLSGYDSSSLSGYDARSIASKQSLLNNNYDFFYEPPTVWKNNYLIMWCIEAMFIVILILISMCFLCMLVTFVVGMVGYKIKKHDNGFVETGQFAV